MGYWPSLMKTLSIFPMRSPFPAARITAPFIIKSLQKTDMSTKKHNTTKIPFILPKYCFFLKQCTSSKFMLYCSMFIMDVKIEKTWKERLYGEFESPYFSRLVTFVKDAYRQGTVYPPASFMPLTEHPLTRQRW